MKNTKFIPTIIVCILSFNLLLPAQAIEITPYYEYDYTHVAVDNLGDDRVATISLDIENNDQVQSIEVLNTKNWEYENIIEITSDIQFHQTEGIHKIVLSGDYLAFTFRDTQTDTEQIAAYNLSNNEPELLFTKNSFDLSFKGYFELYDNFLVLQGFKNDRDRFSTSKIIYIDLEKDVNNIIKINESDNSEYLSPSIYKDNIAYIKDGGIYSYNLNNKTEVKISEILGAVPDIHKNHWLAQTDKYIIYRTFLNNKKNIVKFDLESKENKIIYDFREQDNLSLLEAKDNFIVFVMRAAANLNRKKMYLYDIKNDFLYISDAGNFNFGYPSIGANNIFWTSDKDGKYKVYYADLNNLQNDNQFIEITKLFMADPIKTANLSGRILLQVEKNGEAWYVDSNTRDGSFASEAWYQNEDKQFICYLGRPGDAFDLMRQAGIGITNQDLGKIPINIDEQDGWGHNIDFGKEDNDNDSLYNIFEDAIGTDKNNIDSDGDGYGDKNEIVSGYNPMGPGQLYINESYANNLKGKILLQVENNGEAWYINPKDGERHFLGRPIDAFNLMKFFGLGISNNDFNNLFIK